ncbi:MULTISPECIES: TonB-dependent receptor plug domain-containing protein [Niastella]|uniref:TonB-dependent receptor n=1 Tax=Niastella soli TaxID=2821487 RepID=A0ABS3Z3G1_9BACT|nr:TonB-dependent receptor plug domain-containing protein [Niastella soli]MBO9204711.1 TonB-dependent receptor [Niastella soli]
MKTAFITYALLVLVLMSPVALLAQHKDSVKTLEKVTVGSQRKKPTFTAITPAQSLNRQTLQQINAPSVGDAARFFSGVLVKDYGGAGGLKTVSVRSLGAQQTGVTYDGIAASDAQSGQIDLSKYSVTFVQSIDLQQANAQSLLQPARGYAAAAVLSINTLSFSTEALQHTRWQAGLKAGSFGLWQPAAGMNLVLPKQMAIGVNAEALVSKGNYPYYIDNGSSSLHTKRENGEMRSFQGEVNLLKQFKDSATWQVKLSGYNSSRGLPGVVVFYNERSVQHLWNSDYYVQSRYRKFFNKNTTGLLVSAKASRSYTKYTDPDYLNNAGGLDNRYTQYEYYLSAALSQQIKERLTLSAASDAAYSKLNSNMSDFAYPARKSFWNSLAVNYTRPLWQINGSGLLTTINDQVKTGAEANTISKLTPAVAFSGKLSANSPFMLRLFYKHVFRMPTFNDLYYRVIGNVSLQPEYARQYNVGLVYCTSFKGAIKHFSISADGYYNSIKDKIVAIPNKNLFVWTMLNLGKVNIKGIDVTAEADGALSKQVAWSSRIAYTFQHALDVTDPSTVTYKNRIPYTPDHSGSALLSFNYRHWTTGYSLLFSGTRYVLGENNPYNQLDGWGIHDVFVSRQINIKQYGLQIKGELNNVTDEKYDVVRYFPMPGRSWKISLLINNL